MAAPGPWAVALLVLGLAGAPAAHAAPWMSTTVFGLPISFDECRERVTKALATEGYSGTRDFGNGLLGFTATHSASIGCIRGANETVVSLVLASESDNTRERDRLVALLRSAAIATQAYEGQRLRATVRADGLVVVDWKDTPGNQQDWVAVPPLGAPDDTYGSWTYTQGRASGSKEFGPLAPGDYEVRLYLNWPDGGFTVHERLRIHVGR